MSSVTPSAGSPQRSRPLRGWHLSIAYDGSGFNGWQVQTSVRTVQGELLKHLRRLFANPELRIAGTSRTDAGVHALDQQASFEAETPPEFTEEKLYTLLNRQLPDDIMVTRVRQVPLGFNARFGSYGKAYTYVLNPAERMLPMFVPFAWQCGWKLDLEPMREAAKYLVGEMDFSSFAANPKREIDSHVRLVHRVEILPVDGLICFNVVGHSFLYKMVRSIVGWLVHVGRGASPPEATLDVLAAKDRSEAAESAPAQGLFLAKVFFEPDAWRSYTPILPPFRWRQERRAP